MTEANTIIEDILSKTIGTKIEKNGKEANKPIRTHSLGYDSNSETLEPIYFYLLDLTNSFFGGKVEKLIDNFTSSPGSGHFAELGQRKSIMQKNVTETMGLVNVVIKSIINLIYDLKEFEIRLSYYKDANSEDRGKKQTGILALKQVWMDNVDIKKGNTSIKGMASQFQYVTLIDAFMAADSVEDIEKIDLNERVKRILKPRMAEFLEWKERSEKELQKRFEIEKSYLKTQINTLHLYSKWVKPYIKATRDLEMRGDEKNPELVNVFNTMVLELTLMGKREIDVKSAIDTARLPVSLRKPKRKYYGVLILHFHFRGIPQKVGQHYLFGGKTKVEFKSYVMNEQELKLFEQELKKSEVDDMLELAGEATTESLDQLKEDLDHFLKGDEKKSEKEKSQNSNPFTALFSPLFKKKEKQEKSKEKEITLKDIKKDSYEERFVRELGAEEISEICFTIFDVYKKAHGMASHDSPFE